MFRDRDVYGLEEVLISTRNASKYTDLHKVFHLFACGVQICRFLEWGMVFLRTK